MKKGMLFLLAVLVAAMLACSAGCGPDQEEVQQIVQQAVDKGSMDWFYTKDSRTNICFAFKVTVMGDMRDVTAVPCEAVPPELLTIPSAK